MKTRTRHPCAACQRPAWGRLCAACHAAARGPALPRRRDLSGDWRERQRRARAVQEHRHEHGDICPGWRRPPHPAARLCADHIDEVHAGGDPGGELQVLCASCNSAKSNALRHKATAAICITPDSQFCKSHETTTPAPTGSRPW